MKKKTCVATWLPVSLLKVLDAEAAKTMRNRSSLIAWYIQRCLAADANSNVNDVSCK